VHTIVKSKAFRTRLQASEFLAIGRDNEIDFRVTLGGIYGQTNSYLARLARAVEEGRAVDEANNFLRWLQFSGVLHLLERHSHIDQKFITLRKSCEDLQFRCQKWLQGQNVKLPPSVARVDEVNQKMDFLLSALARRGVISSNEPLVITNVETLQIGMAAQRCQLE
jgi:hypothetical protein